MCSLSLSLGLTLLPLTSNRLSCNAKVPDVLTNDVVLRRLWGSGLDSCDQMAEVGRWDFGLDPWDGCIVQGEQGANYERMEWDAKADDSNPRQNTNKYTVRCL